MCGSEFAGKVALVTGGASGIGEACVRTFAVGGANVVIADLNEDLAEEVATVVRRAGVQALPLTVDVSDPDACEHMVAAAVRTFGRLDIAVNNAGIGDEQAEVGEHSVDGWRKVIDVNLSSVFYCLRAEIPQMVGRGGGAIVNMASILGAQSFSDAPAYIAAKHGVVGLTQAAALEYARQGVRVNAVGPGFVKTPLAGGSLNGAAHTHLAAMRGMARLGEPEEIADLVAYLCSSGASFLTGGFYVADGGYSAQ
jgi:NAD(P)-dependent dehydrogenase (short-subunit alcohol dehydrogenase family)